MSRICFLLIVLGLCATCPAQPDLRTFSTEHYTIHTDLDADLAYDLGQRMDVMWDEYARRMCDFTPALGGPKLEAYLFTRRQDYIRLTGDRFSNTGGIFIPSQHLLAAFLEVQGRDGIRRTLQHEAFHQFAQVSIGSTMPIWLNEGIAQVFEEGIWTGSEFLIGQVPPKRLQLLQDDLRDNRITDFGQFMQISNAQWASNLRYKPIATSQYNQAWAMAQFLIFATDAHGEPKYRDRLIDMLRMIHAGRDGNEAFAESFSSNTSGFQRRFTEWARKLNATAEATYTEHQAILADMLISLGAQGRQFADITTFRQCLSAGGYRLQQSGGRDLSPDAFFCDPTGRPLGPSQLFFAATPDSAVPDLVCHPAGDLEFRTRFLRDTSGSLDYETVVRSD